MVVSAEPWSPRFSAAARGVAEVARHLGLDPPGFRSPPAKAGVDRTLRRLPDGRCVVAVRARGRALSEVVDDLIEGVLAANAVEWGRRDELREAFWRALPADGLPCPRWASNPH